MKHRIALLLSAVSAMAFMASAVQAAALTLVEDGQARCAVVVADGASASEKWAAEEFVLHVRQMSGAQIETLNAPPADGRVALVIGAKSLPANDPLLRTLDELGEEGYAIETRKGALVIVGGSLRGTMYGVFTLLEQMGVRWWTPAETHIPEMATIRVAEMKLREKPAMEYRDLMFRETWDGEAARKWYAHNKLNGYGWEKGPEKMGLSYRFHGNLVHSYMNLLKLSGMEIKPEMLALRGNSRQTTQPCLTNPDTLKAMVAGVLKAYEKEPTAHFVVVGQQDNDAYCQCETCKALAERENPSGMVIQFANQVAEAVEKARPGSYIATPAYNWSQTPPKTLRPRHNVHIVLCSIKVDFSHPLAVSPTPASVSFRDDLVAWGKMTNKLIIWDYLVNFHHYLMPHPNLDVLTANIKFFADNHAAGYFGELGQTGRATENQWLRMWVLAKALWNPELDNKKLIDEFVAGYYGPAADDIHGYFSAMHRLVRKTPDMHVGTYVEFNAPFLDPQDIAEAELCLRRAAEKVKGQPLFESRVRHARMPIWYVLANRGIHSRTWQAVEAKVGKMSYDEVADNLLATIKEWKVSHVAEHSAGQPWFDWLADYSRRIKAGENTLPPELKGRDMSNIRFVQAGMFDGNVSWLKQYDGASDGWGQGCGSAGWYLKYYFNPTEDFTPGKKYRLFVRARPSGLNPEASGRAWEAAVWRGSIRRSFCQYNRNVDKVKEDGDGWKVHDMGTWEPQYGDLFYAAIRSGSVMKQIQVDCIWMEEVE